MKVSFPIGEKASVVLRWGIAFAVVVFVYGGGAWLLLRQNPSELDSSGLQVMLDLSTMPGLPAAASDRTLEPIRETSRSIASAPSETPPASPQGVENDRFANLAGDANGGGKMKDERPAGTDNIETAAVEQPARSEAPSKAEMPPDTGGGAKPVIAARPTTTPDGDPADFLAKMPIDTSITVYQWRSPNSSKGTKQSTALVQSRGLVEVKGFNIANELKQLQQRLSNRPVSIAALPSNHDHGNPAGHQSGSAMRADATPERNAIGILIDHRANPQPSLSLGEPIRLATTAQASGGPASGPLGIAVAARGDHSHLSEAARGDEHMMQSANHGSPAQGTAVASIGGPNVNATGMARSGIVTGTLGGPARTFAGVLNGTSFHARHP